MYFMLVRMPLRRKPGDVYSRNCRVGRRGEGSDQALMGAGSWARHSIKNTESWPNGFRSTQIIWEAKCRFQVAGSTFPPGSASRFAKRSYYHTIDRTRVLWIVSPVMFGVSA